MEVVTTTVAKGGIFESALMGNVISIISLLVGIISLILTIVTYLSANKIQKQVEDLKLSAIIRSQLHDKKPELKKQLEIIRDSVIDAEAASKSVWKQTLSIVGQVEKFKDIFSNEDNDIIIQCKEDIVKMIKSVGVIDNSSKVIDICNQIINILEKGEYAL